MLEKSGSFTASTDMGRAGPDYFRFFARAVKELISQNEDALHVDCELSGQRCGNVNGNVKGEPSSSSFFSSSVGAGLSNQKKERLNVLLRLSVEELTPEVEEILDPVLQMRKLQSKIRKRKLSSDDTNEVTTGGTKKKTFKKRTKTLTSSSVSITKPARPINSGSYREVHCDAAAGNEGESHLASNESGDKGDEEGDDDLQFLMMNDSTLVEEALKKYSDQLLTTLGHMEKQLEELLDVVVSTCRPMNTTEKQQLKKLIQKLPPENLNRIVEIVERSNPEKTQCSDEVFVDLERKDNATLWRLYYYTEAVEKARKLAMVQKIK